MKSSQFVLLVLLLVSIINCQDLGADDYSQPITDIDHDNDSDYEELHRIIVQKQKVMKNLYDISEMNSDALSRIIRRRKGLNEIETSEISEELLEGLNLESYILKYMGSIDRRVCKMLRQC